MQDSNELRRILTSCLPVSIDDVAAPSGQRVVYFAKTLEITEEFKDFFENSDYEWGMWGEVVLKVSNGSNPTQVARLQQEVDILAALEIQGFPKLLYQELLTFDRTNENPLNPKLYVTIEEKINGYSLADIFNTFNSESKVTLLIFRIISALKDFWMHKNRYVHRDLKPANLLIKEDGQVVVIDLGIARETGSEGFTLTSHNIGPCTPEYASPEQALNLKSDITFKTDFFSIGTLAYAMLKGANPFSAGCSPGDYSTVLYNVINFTPPSLYELGIASKPFSDVIEKMMQKDPYKRYRKIDLLIKDFNELLRSDT